MRGQIMPTTLLVAPPSGFSDLPTVNKKIQLDGIIWFNTSVWIWPIIHLYFELSGMSKHHTVVLWLICWHREPGNSTYMKPILTKNLTFINIIYHTKFWFAKMSGSLGKFSIFCYIKVTEFQKITFFFHSSSSKKKKKKNVRNRRKIFFFKNDWLIFAPLWFSDIPTTLILKVS